MHQRSVFKSIEAHSKATRTTHVEAGKEIHCIGITMNNLVNSRVLANHHNFILPLPTHYRYDTMGFLEGQYLPYVWELAMSKKCDVCNKGPMFGNNVSHAKNATRRRWNPNLKKMRVNLHGSIKSMKVCTSCLKANKVTKAIN